MATSRCWILVAVAVQVVQLGRSLETYSILSYAQIETRIKALANNYGNFVRLTTAQDEFGLPTRGTCTGSSPCLNYIVQVTNFATLDEDTSRPEVFFSGELHGNERVGPTATVVFMEKLMELYETNAWVKRLVDTRSIFVMPMPNALGYFQKVRGEGSVDVNRDFPIDSPGECMQSVAARSLNELFKAHLFQLAITFHSGVDMIGFTWGSITSQNKNKDISPDDTSQIMMGSTMSAYGGATAENRRYPHGRMNDLIYAVRGGMEDWAYAASWPLNGHKASPCGQNDYDDSKTAYDSKQLRTINILIETSNVKAPTTRLGTDAEIFKPDGTGDGHIPRNVRMMFFVTDIVQPYVEIVESDPETNTFSWEVGGALFVDKTYLQYTFVKNGRTLKRNVRPMKGKTRWGGGGLNYRLNRRVNRAHLKGRDINLDEEFVDRSKHPYIPAFKTKLRLPRGAALASVQIFAQVDKAWARNPGRWPNLPPQSHFVNARTNPKWNVELNGRQVKSQLLWSSDKTCFDTTSKDVIQCT